MVVTTALCFILGAICLFAIRFDRRRLVTGAVLAMMTIGWLGCLGYLFGVRALYDVGPLSTMAAQTAAAIVILGVGLLASIPGGALAWIVRGRDPGATVLRIVLPLALIGFPVVGELRLAGQHAGWYGTEFGLAIMVVVASLSVTTMAMFGARAVNRTHAATISANQQLLELNASLEDRIQARTAELAKSGAWSKALAGSAPIGIFHSGADGRRTYVNDRICEIYGISREQAMEGAIGTGIHDEDRERVLTAWASALATGVEFDCEFRVVQPSGITLWVRAHGAHVLRRRRPRLRRDGCGHHRPG